MGNSSPVYDAVVVGSGASGGWAAKRLSEGGLGDSIVQAILALAKTLGVSVTAEGVETLTQALTLKAMACHAVQGYYFSEPVPAHQIPELATKVWSIVAPGPESLPAPLLTK